VSGLIKNILGIPVFVMERNAVFLLNKLKKLIYYDNYYDIPYTL